MLFTNFYRILKNANQNTSVIIILKIPIISICFTSKSIITHGFYFSYVKQQNLYLINFASLSKSLSLRICIASVHLSP